MAALEEKYTKYLDESGILPRLLEILEKLVDLDPLPADPLMEILDALGCQLIPQAQMKSLERKVSRAQDELRYLRRVLIELGGHDELYDSDTDEDEYVGQVTEMGVTPLYSPNTSSEDDSSTSQYILEASISVSEQQQQQHEQEQEPCCSHDLRINAHHF
ncbi:uncharacterized protein LOC6574596 [Drosophila mojavensis]|uniref:Uncharacterized protein n=1 Tax=Drosophila mojavensis TaxID=7230 RepID=B4K4U1_DROMO|nr:uncharacterized protein LOC6574596 [Drosophila mojavensis]EDW16094.1 uncharacterized protein Dmoj_GI10337 [Drosophila mojavensis]